MTPAVFCEKYLVATHVKSISSICQPRLSKFCKEKRQESIQTMKFRSKGGSINNISADGLNSNNSTKLNLHCLFFPYNKAKFCLSSILGNKYA